MVGWSWQLNKSGGALALKQHAGPPHGTEEAQLGHPSAGSETNLTLAATA